MSTETKQQVLVGKYFLRCDCGNEEDVDVRYPVDKFSFLNLEHLDGYWIDNYSCLACGNLVYKFVGEAEDVH